MAGVALRRVAYGVVCCIVLFNSFACAQSNSDEVQQARANYLSSKTAMESTLSEIEDGYAEHPVFLEKLELAQRAWTAYRDAHVDAHFPLREDENAKEVYGSAYLLCRLQLLRQMTDARTRELQPWIEGFMEGDVCSGSVRRR